ncbi:mitochondrial import receptor subunit TOM9-1-like [Ipomoea triloba]|uniref:mitochondrial import receptor subunit TOM9-1-like n=1 Tax=Ipomoea triloba TaxID=35885 RepID=UPI00125CE70D|nr:mitochondrial import receptor subunit TOM9-1-like [Ipomoea triloba]GLL41210.1 mitochondrial import receptor subunit TOM9-2-like [Ipomoea trifida]
MASKGKSSGGSSDRSIISRVSDSSIVRKGKSAACDAAYVGKRLAKSTGKAAWIAATTLLIIAVPLIIVMDREQQLNELDLQQASLLGTPSVGPPQK